MLPESNFVIVLRCFLIVSLIFGIVSLFLYDSYLVNEEDEYCFSSETKPISNLGIWTNYEDIRGSNIEIPKNCKPIYLWSLIHTPVQADYTLSEDQKNSISKMIEDITKNHEKKHKFLNYIQVDKLCDEDVAKLKEWTNSKVDISNDLLAFIKTNTKNWVERLKNAFDKISEGEQLFTKPTAGEEFFEIQSSNTEEAKAGASEIARILYGSENLNGGHRYHVINDDFYEIYKYCPPPENAPNPWWKKLSKSKKFITGMKRFNNRLGFQRMDWYNIDELFTLYTSCAMSNFQNRSQPFCATLLPEHLKMGEYLFDLIDLYEDGYEHPNSANLGCPIIKSMLNNLTNAAQNESLATKASFFSSDNLIFLGTLVKLGLFHDEYFPDFDDDDATISNRKWKNSFISPSSANLIAALYKCPQNDSKPQVAFFFNEKPISMPGCDGNLCSLDFLKNTFAKVLEPGHCRSQHCDSTE